MSRTFTKVLLALSLASLCVTSYAAKGEPYTQPGTDAREILQTQPIHWVSIEQIKQSLEGKGPISVSFDIDDTVLFSSPCFHYGQNKYSPNSGAYLKNQEFWNEINAGCDQYSIPKLVAKELIKMHQERGDQVYFITGRTAGKVDGVTPILEKAFAIKNMYPVSFMGGVERTTKYNKTPAIQKYKISIHYGDSDDDILAAKEANIRAIRLLRAPNSTYLPLPKVGGYGEEVLVNSAY